MAGVGRISLLIDSPLRTASLAFRGLDPEIQKQITNRLKPVATTAWAEETRGHALTRMQSRVLAGTARAGVAGMSVTLRAGGAGRLSSGTATAAVSFATAFGANPDKQWPVRRNGKTYTRRMGARFPLPNSQGGYVFYPAAREAIPRVASLAVQTAVRTTHELIEGLGG